MSSREFIDMDDKYFDSFFNILLNSFPINERRDYLSQKELLCKNNYKPFVFIQNGEILAIMATWEFNNFIFIEHLAVDHKLRGKGIGTELIKKFINKCQKDIFLEVEPPNCNVSRKRILFYEKLGFCFNDFDYLQPPLNPNDSPLKLNIMSYSRYITHNEFEEYKISIYKEVYNVNM